MPKRATTADPHFPELKELTRLHRKRRSKSWIFKTWVKQIYPDKPTITEKQYINWTRYHTDAEFEIEEAQKSDVAHIVAQRRATLSDIEESLREVTDLVVDEAKGIMQNNQDEQLPLKERYYALTVVDKVWGKVIKEKEIAIKANAEKRETVGLFAKLLRGAMAGEFSLADLNRLKEAKNGHPTETTPGT